MNSGIRYAAILSLGILIAAILLLVFPDVNRSRAKARTVVPAADLPAGTTARPLILVPPPLPSPTPIGKPPSPRLEDTLAVARANFALASKGTKASASSAAAGYDPSGAIDGDRKGLNFGKDGYWSSKTGTFPEWLQIEFKGKRTITEIDVFTIQDNYASPAEPTPTMEFKTYGLTDFDVEEWVELSGVPFPGGDSRGFWVPISGGSRRGNELVWNQVDLSASPVTATKIRVEGRG